MRKFFLIICFVTISLIAAFTLSACSDVGGDQGSFGPRGQCYNYFVEN